MHDWPGTGREAKSARPGGAGSFPWAWLLIYLLVIALVVTAGLVFLRYLQDRVKTDAQQELEAIADLKAGQIEGWAEERYGDARAASESPFFTESAREFIADPGDEELREDLLTWMDSRIENYGYCCVFLLDGGGRELMSASTDDEPLGAYASELALQVIAGGEIVISDLYFGEDNGNIHIDVTAPIPSAGADGAPAAGAVLFRIDPHRFLYPLIQSWPTPSDSSETLLVRLEGDEVVFLNELRHSEEPALTVRLPASEEGLPGAMAVSGVEGIVEGTDYRGVEVLAGLRAIPGTEWYLVAKVDAAEIYSPITSRAWLVISLTVVLVLALGLLFAFAWSRRQGQFYRERYRLEAERAALARHYDYLTRYANDIMVLMDQEWRIVDVNQRALQAYGYTREELLEMKANELRAPHQRPSFGETISRLNLENGTVFETEHMRKDGSTFPVEISARIIQVDGNSYFQGIIRDITERRRMEAELRSSEERYRLLIRRSPIGFFHYDMDMILTDCNDRFVETMRSSYEKLLGLDMNELSDRRVLPALRSALEGMEEHYEGPYRATTSDAEPYVSLRTAPLFDPGRKVIGGIGIVEDITERMNMHRELEEHELFLRRITDNMLDLISQTDASGNFVYLSPSNQVVLGYEEGELLGTNVMDLVHPDDLAAVAEAYERSLREGIPGKAAFRARRADGSYVWVESIGNPLLDGRGETVGAIFVTRDISERKWAEEALAREREQLLSIFESINQIIYVSDPDTCEILYVNRALRDLLGKDPTGGICYREFQGFEEPCSFCTNDIIREMAPEPYLWEYHNPRLDRDFMLIDRMIAWPGRLEARFEMGVDITGRKRAEQRLERLNRCFLELGTDPLENIIMVVETGMEILQAAGMHYSRVSDGIFYLYHTLGEGEAFERVEDAERLICYAVIAEDRREPIAVEDLPSTGYEGFLPEVTDEGLGSYLGYPVRAHGVTVGVLGLLRRQRGEFGGEERDLLGMLARAVAVEEERLAHEEELRDFIDIASHELRHPMTIIKGYAATLRSFLDKMDDATREKVFEDIDRGVDRLERLVYQLLDTSRIERRKLALERTEIEVGAVLEEAAAEMRGRLPACEISIRIDGEVGRVEADPQKVVQVLVVLLENAYNYSPPGSPVEVEAAPLEGGGVTVAVMDRGWGVPEGDRERIFERFYQVGDAKHHSAEGIGLGLHIAREIVEAHGGGIWQEPREGGGSIFRFTLP